MSNSLDLTAARAALERELSELCQLNEISGESTQTVELDQSKVGRLSRMDAMQQQAMNIEQNRRRQVRTQQIQAALQRIKNDDYGYCLDCGEDINPRRLEVNPATPYCTACADGH